MQKHTAKKTKRHTRKNRMLRNKKRYTRTKKTKTPMRAGRPVVASPVEIVAAPPPQPNKIDQAFKNLLVSKLANPSENLSKVLQVVCKDTDNCLAIGHYGVMIKSLFEDFRNLSLINVDNIRSLGNPSSNGFVLECPFHKNNYAAYTVLKSSASPTADNLFYEYYVGTTFINKLLARFPVFVETYDCYKYKSQLKLQITKQIAGKLTSFKASHVTDLSVMISRVIHGDLLDVTEIKKVFENSCVDSESFSILIQHFNNFMTIKELLITKYIENEYDFPYLFYQVYFALSVIGNKYTHYDLHAGNVCVYKPYAGNNYILMRYHSKGKIYEFPSEYIVKIIDYGHNYVSNGATNTDRIIHDIICKTNECQPECGVEQGYSVISTSDSLFHNIMPVAPNASHDLRVFNELNNYKSYNFWKDKIYTGDVYYETMYGTPEDLTGNSAKIRSIHDLRAAIEETAHPQYKDEIYAKKYATWTKVAEMDVYDDNRDYVFTQLI